MGLLLTSFLCESIVGLREDFFFYFRSLPLAVFIYSFGARAKISPPNFLAPDGSVLLFRYEQSELKIKYAGITEKRNEYFKRCAHCAPLFLFIWSAQKKGNGEAYNVHLQIRRIGASDMNNPCAQCAHKM